MALHSDRLLAEADCQPLRERGLPYRLSVVRAGSAPAIEVRVPTEYAEEAAALLEADCILCRIFGTGDGTPP